MRFASTITGVDELSHAASELLDPLDEAITVGMVDLVLLFATPHFDENLAKVIRQIEQHLPHAMIVGCTAEGVIGRNRELERVPAMSMLVASIPDVAIRPFHMTQRQLEAADNLSVWERMIGVSPENDPTFIAMADPFRLDVMSLTERINEFYPNSALVGGVASGGSSPGSNQLIVGGEMVREGVVGVSLSGGLVVDTVVSQGCRPISQPFVITKGEKNIVRELGGKPTLERLHGVIQGLSPKDRGLARQSLFLGRVIDEHKETFTRGDFLVQNILSADRSSGALAIAGHARLGTTVQFHVRDAASADEDLRALLQPFTGVDVRGALLFGCNGRGTRMWPEPGHDAGVVHRILDDIPLSGFFCGGEFGPIGGKNFIHGFTASIALFREKDGASG